MSQHNRKVVVLDRDGTVIVDKHYLADPDGVELERGALQGLQAMAQLGYRFVIVSNQSGIARGYFGLKQLEAVNSRLREMLAVAGIQLEGIYCCPHAPSDGCECRKPNLGLMRQAAEELRFDMAKSVVIGDKHSDIEFGRLAGALTMLVATTDGPPRQSVADYVVRNLAEAAHILERHKHDGEGTKW